MLLPSQKGSVRRNLPIWSLWHGSHLRTRPSKIACHSTSRRFLGVFSPPPKKIHGGAAVSCPVFISPAEVSPVGKVPLLRIPTQPSPIRNVLQLSAFPPNRLWISVEQGFFLGGRRAIPGLSQVFCPWIRGHRQSHLGSPRPPALWHY